MHTSGPTLNRERRSHKIDRTFEAAILSRHLEKTSNCVQFGVESTIWSCFIPSESFVFLKENQASGLTPLIS